MLLVNKLTMHQTCSHQWSWFLDQLWLNHEHIVLCKESQVFAIGYYEIQRSFRRHRSHQWWRQRHQLKRWSTHVCILIFFINNEIIGLFRILPASWWNDCIFDWLKWLYFWLNQELLIDLPWRKGKVGSIWPLKSRHIHYFGLHGAAWILKTTACG